LPDVPGTRRHSVVIRWSLVGLVLLVEYLFTSLRYDAQTVVARGGAWAALSHAGRIGPLVACLASAALLFLAKQRPSFNLTLRRPSAPLLAFHGVLFAGFVWTTAKVFGGADPPAMAPLWVAAWVACALAAPAALIAGAIGASALRALLSPGFLAFLSAIGVAAWVAGTLTLELWVELSRVTLIAAEALLGVFVTGVVSEPENLELGLGDFRITVAAVCSGYEGLGLMTVLVGSYLWAFRARLRFPRALLLLPLGLVLVWCGNVVRIAALVALGAFVNADLAYGAFHSKAGWVLFCTIALSVVAIGHRAPFLLRERTAPDAEFENPTAAYLVPLIALLGTALVTSMFANEVDVAYGARLVTVGVALYVLREYYAELERPRSWLAPAVGALVAAVWISTERWAGAAAGSSQPPAAIQAWSPLAYGSWVVLRVVGTAVVVPICEELAFRGYLMRRLVRRDFQQVSFRHFAPLALIGSSLAFGVFHQRWVVASLCGLAYGLVQLAGGRLSDAVVAHGTTNALIAAWVLVTGDWSSWN
jgi:exosortase E/protease (VPEID-CTERM system)